MRRYMKVFLSYLLIFVLVLSDMHIIARAESDSQEKTFENEMAKSSDEPYIISEITEKREKDKKVFLMSDGTYKASVYEQPVHYKKDEKWIEYDNTLSEVDSEENHGDKDLVNKASDVKIYLSKKTNGKKFVRVEKDGHKISWNYVDANKVTAEITEQEVDNDETTLENVSSQAVYKEVYKKTDFIYILDSQTIKENIVLNDASAPHEFEIEYKANGLNPVLMDNRTIDLCNDKGEKIYTISAPYMIDSVGNISNEISFDIIKSNQNKFTVKLYLDSEWLLDEDRIYPVIADPVIQSSQNWDDETLCHSAYIASATPNAKYGRGGADYEGSLYVGYTSGRGKTRGLIKNPTLPTLGIADKVVHAEMAIYVRACYPELKIDLHRVTSDWNQNSVCWNSNVQYDSSIVDYQFVQYMESNTANADRWQRFEITDLVRGWYSGEIPNYGIMLRSDAETNSTQARAWFFSSGYTTLSNPRPVLLVTYRNMSGYEDYWTYTDIATGKSGTLSVNNYNGNLVLAQPLTLDSGGNLMPVEIGLIYNSNGVSTQFEGDNTAGYSYMAENMQTNYHMYIRQDTTTASNGYRYFLHDGDGTRHWFYFENESAKSGKDEDGLGYTLDLISQNSDSACTEASYRITDKNNNRMYFNSLGNLIQMTNANNISATVQYENVSGYLRIKSITDGAGRTYSFLYHPNYDYLVEGITDPAGRKTQFIYWSGFMTEVIFPDGKIYNLRYTDTLLTKFIGRDFTQTVISYDNSSQKRVASIKWGSKDNDFLEQYTFLYKQNETTVVDIHNRSYTYQFNDYGQTTGIVSNSDGSAQFYEITSGNNTSNTTNKLLSQSRAIKTVTNYVINPGFVRNYSSGYWTYAPDSTGSPTVTIDTTKGNLTKNALKVYKSSNNTNNVMAVQNVSGLSPGTYTISAYVNTYGATLTGTGAYFGIEFRDSQGVLDYVNKTETIIKTDTWQRVSLTFVLPENHTFAFVAGFDSWNVNSYGTVWFDDIQLEKGSGISSYNLIENSGITNGTVEWTPGNVEGPANLNGFHQAVYEDADVTNRWDGIGQHIQTYSGKKGDTFSFGAWIKVDSAPVNNGTKTADTYAPGCALALHFYDSTGRWYYAEIIDVNDDITSWQFVAGGAIAPNDYSKVCIELMYYYNVNRCGMVGAFCYKDEFGQSYTYDNDGNVISTVDVSNMESTFAYKNNQLTKMLNPSGSKYFYSYDYNESNLMNAISTDGQQYSFTYDSAGNILSTTVEKDKPDSNPQAGTVYIIRNAQTGNVLERGDVDKYVHNWRYRRGESTQQWELVSTNEENVYYLKCCSTNSDQKYLYVKNSADADNTDMMVSSTPNTEAHKFKLHANGDGTFCILTKASNYTKCLDSLPGSSKDTTDGSALKQYTRINDDQSQHWLFYPDILDSNTSEETSKKIINLAEYTEDKNFLSSQSDARGNTTIYNYDNVTGNLDSITDATGNITSYVYNEYTDYLTSVTTGGITNRYTYSEEKLETINVNNATYYKFLYDNFGRTIAIQIGDGTNYKNLSTIEYNSAGCVAKQTYGNGNYIAFQYDSLDRLTEKMYNDNYSHRMTYDYGNDGRLSHCIDFAENTITRYIYDVAGRIVEYKVFHGTDITSNDLRRKVIYHYSDKTNYIERVEYVSELGSQTISYNYGNLANETMPDTVYTVGLNGTEQIRYSFDDLARLSTRTITPINKTQSYTYLQGGHGEDSTTTLVESVNVDGVTTSYSYDALGNINAIYINGELYESYEYDSLNQLVKVIKGSNTYEYTYCNGNITSVKLNGEIIKNYSYTNNQWSDQLTAYNGESISYDEIGNPLNYRDGMVFTWQKGRTLSSVVDGENNFTYNYNGDGLRVSKTVNGVTTFYTYVDGRLIGEQTGNNTLIYLYDENGNKYGFTYNGNNYYYNLNLQGDVIGIYDASGNDVVEYTYDVWGELIAITGSLASTIGEINPIRYRGYYYDAETGFYYLIYQFI